MRAGTEADVIPSPRLADSARLGLLYLTEPARALVDAASLLAGLPLLQAAPRGDGHPVLVLPGLLTGDSATITLRRWISGLGYPVAGWHLGPNRGPTRAGVDGLPRLVERLSDNARTPITVIGWSLGGIFARALALRTPGQIRQVITLGSPIATDERGERHDARPQGPGELAYRRLTRLLVSEGHTIYADHDGLRGPLPVPSTSVFTRWDGIVDWRSCRQPAGPRSENVEVPASHLGLGYHPAVLWVVADRLSQPADSWHPFRAPWSQPGREPGREPARVPQD